MSSRHKEMVDYVLARTPISKLNESLKQHSVQMLYGRLRIQMMSEFPELFPTRIAWSIFMADAFRPYTVVEVERCRKLEAIMRDHRPMAVSRHLHESRKAVYRGLYNAAVNEYNELIKPEGKLIRRYKRVNQKVATND